MDHGKLGTVVISVSLQKYRFFWIPFSSERLGYTSFQSRYIRVEIELALDLLPTGRHSSVGKASQWDLQTKGILRTRLGYISLLLSP